MRRIYIRYVSFLCHVSPHCWFSVHCFCWNRPKFQQIQFAPFEAPIVQPYKIHFGILHPTQNIISSTRNGWYAVEARCSSSTVRTDWSDGRENELHKIHIGCRGGHRHRRQAYIFDIFNEAVTFSNRGKQMKRLNMFYSTVEMRCHLELSLASLAICPRPLSYAYGISTRILPPAVSKCESEPMRNNDQNQ